ncbi:alpha/beta hydrolase-fold protein [Chitinophaga ginsengisegetis]|uniref:alpha/beta hydrolase-fold protein n=1 Tax=Chitinophaga ginsengisegetis TaxID=393003 RepID=UPI000DB95302|nr:alpha/beta hydrolase-fold protein [Chitinophaga ginsengisegetis]MDR6567542.1 putative alpha/beta superfamily hydrolase [Chitinophaga ginsengisegetis]MDR6647903.1 putative alpha/beta superfamily hydrolase [Chitinophaga ginsengisegetis]MDR6654253.1 putative alpha/beta superfamily hydrolase [Chitinophaga ginsengisegetis]
MKKLSLAFFILCAFISATAQLKQSLVSFGQPDSIYSAVLKENRPLWIYTPPDDTSYFVKPAYPVVYVLDGDFHFSSLQSMILQLSTINGNTALPRMIIVGIPNTGSNRTRDLTPTPDSMYAGSGGGEAFTEFIGKELIPYIDKKYATAPYRTLIGHSLGGLMVVNTLLHHRELFNGYIAIDPSLFWNKGQILQQATRQLQQPFKNKSLYLAVAHTMKPGLDTVQLRKDTSQGSVHTSAILTLTDLLRKFPGNQLKWSYKYYEDDDHNSIPFVGEYDGLRFLFPHYRFPTYLYTDNSCPADSLKTLITTHFNTLSKDMGYRVRPYETTLNEFGYANLQRKNFDKSKMFFQLNIDYYPESFNTYDGMGDYYLEMKDTVHANIFWKKALSIRFTKEIKDKMEMVNNTPSR